MDQNHLRLTQTTTTTEGKQPRPTGVNLDAWHLPEEGATSTQQGDTTVPAWQESWKDKKANLALTLQCDHPKP